MKAKLLVLYMLSSLTLLGQSQLKGRVVDDGNQAMPGVNVLIKGSSQGTVTDAEGTFALDNVPENAKLVFSFIGYATQQINYTGQTGLEVKLIIDVTALQEVVVIGYGTSTVKELTGSVSSVKGEDLTVLNPVRIDQALQGKAAGVQINAASGSPGGSFNIRIRGFTTNGDNNPLILVDGIPYAANEGLGALNPSDIETIDILKDGTAGIYGVRAANGVIIITTKQGRKNSKPSVEFSTYAGIQESAQQLNLLNAREFAVLKNEAAAAGGQALPYNNVNLGEGTNWQEEVFGTAPIQNHNLSITGGSDKSVYSFGGSYYDQEGIVGRDKASYRRYNARINFTTDLFPKLKFQNVLLYTNERRKTLPENTISSVLYNAINASPIATPQNADGSFTYLEDVNDVINPLAQVANSFNETHTNKIFGKQELTFKATNEFEITGRAGYSYALVDYKSFSPLVYYGASKAQNTAANGDLDPIVSDVNGVPTEIPNSVTESRTTYLDYNFEAFLNYNKNINEVHTIKGTLGTSFLGSEYESVSGTAYGVPYNSYEYADISLTDSNFPLNNSGSFQGLNRLQSFFLRGEYGYEGKYLASVVIRRDASSRFGINNRVGYFPSGSAAWLISEEDFFNSQFIEFLKLRASYGVIGNDKIGDFTYRALLGGEGVYAFNDALVTGRTIGVSGNPDLKWETTQQTNIGVDVTLLSGSFDITLDYYTKKTKDLLYNPDISAIVGSYGAGSAPPTVNNGDVKNSGLEFSITYKKTLSDKLNFSVNYNLTTINNEVTRLPDGVAFTKQGSFSVGGGTTSRTQVGYPFGAFFGYKTEGVYQNEEEIAERGVTQSGPAVTPGDFRFSDNNGDGVVDLFGDEDKTFLGSPIPDVIMGLSLNVNYAGFDLSTTLYASIGNEIVRNYERLQPLANNLDYVINRWTGEGSTNEYPKLTTAATNNQVFSDYFVEDGSFLRIRNMQVGYTLPASITNKIGVRKLRIYLAANNLATFTKYMGYDPDFSSGNPIVSGVDYGYYPQARTYMGGLSLNF